jgi:hypothetical protein
LRLIVAVALVFAGSSVATGQDVLYLAPEAARAFVDSAAHEYYPAKFALYPAYATSMGIHSFDSTLCGLGAREVRRFVILTKRLDRELASLVEDSLDIQTWIDMKALRSDMATQLLFLEDMRLWQKSPMLYVEACTNGLYYLTIRDTSFWVNPALASRIDKIPGVLGSGRENLTQPIRLHCELAAAEARAFLPFIDGLLATPLGDTEAGAAALDEAYRAMDGFAAWLDSAGLSADPEFALGRDNLVRLLAAQQGTDLSPEEVVTYAQGVLKDSRTRLAALPPAPEPGRLDLDAAARLTAEEILGFYRAEAESAAAFLVRKDIVDVSLARRLRVAQTPGFIRVLVPGYAYQPPGPFDADGTGLLYVPLADSLNPEEKMDFMQAAGDRDFRGIMVHEVFPGHHLQMSAPSSGSFTRRLQQSTFTAEGWALYSEQVMADEGYYGGEGERIMLDGLVARAARAIVDIRLQLGEFSLAQAADFMARETGRSRNLAEREVRQYAVDPTQAMSYLMGRRAILGLRDSYKRMRGREYSQREFHDTLLGCGVVQPYLLGVCVTSKVLGRQ